MDTAPMIACRPVDTSQLPDIPELPPRAYTGSIPGNCTLCDQPIYIGPRAQMVLQADPSTPTYCYLCAATIVNIGRTMGADDPLYVNMGNPEFGT
jgi:hypothetical protein